MSVHSKIAVGVLLISACAAPSVWADVPPPAPADTAAAPADPGATPSFDSGTPGSVLPPEVKAEEKSAVDPRETIANGLVKRGGTVQLPGGQARIVVSEKFAFLDAADAQKLLTGVWGNPPDAAGDVLGAIIPADVSVLEPACWAAIITYENDGHVSDSDASTIDYTSLLKDMQEATAANSEERVKAGYEPISLVGWAQAPSYDAKEHKLFWAKDVKFGADAHTLNYAIRALGRTGVLQINVVGDMKQLSDINAQVPNLLSMISFNDGNRYADYKEGSDPLAAYGLAALVAGGVAAKAGLFKGLLVFLAASWKIVAFGVVAVGAALRRIIGGLLGGRAKGPDAT